MPKEVWLTTLGGFLSAAAGVLLFFIQRCKEKGDEQQDILFRIYQLMWNPTIVGRGMEAFDERRQMLKDVRELCFLI